MGFVDCKGEARKHLKRPFFSFQESILGMHIRLVGWKWGEGIIKISQWSGIWTTTSYIAASPVNSFQRLENYSSPMKFCKLTSSAHLADVISYSSKLPSSKLFSFSCSVAQSCPALYDLMDCSPPGSNVHGISLQARILEWVVISSSRESSWPRDWTHVSCIAKQILLPPNYLGSLNITWSQRSYHRYKKKKKFFFTRWQTCSKSRKWEIPNLLTFNWLNWIIVLPRFMERRNRLHLWDPSLQVKGTFISRWEKFLAIFSIN